MYKNKFHNKNWFKNIRSLWLVFKTNNFYKDKIFRILKLKQENSKTKN